MKARGNSTEQLVQGFRRANGHWSEERCLEMHHEYKRTASPRTQHCYSYPQTGTI